MELLCYQGKLKKFRAFQFNGNIKELAENLTNIVICVEKSFLVLHTEKRSLFLKESDWIIIESDNSFWICSDSFFSKNYEPFQEEKLIPLWQRSRFY